MIITQRGVLPPVNFAEMDASVQASLLGPAGARLITAADIDTLTAAVVSSAAVALQVRGVSKRLSFTNAAGTVEECSIGAGGTSNLNLEAFTDRSINLFSADGTNQISIPSDNSGVLIRTREAGIQALAGQIATFRVALLHYEGTSDTITKSFRITSVTKNGTGDYTVDYTAAGFGSNPYVIAVCQGAAPLFANSIALSNTSTRYITEDETGTEVDSTLRLIAITT